MGLQEVWSPGYNLVSNFIEGVCKLAGYPCYGRATVPNALYDNGFKYTTKIGHQSTQWYQGFWDSGCVIASRIPFQASDVRMTNLHSDNWQYQLFASKVIMSVKLEIKDSEGEQVLGNVIVANAHPDWYDGNMEDGDDHYQFEVLRTHVRDHMTCVQKSTGKPVSAILCGDMNTVAPLKGGFKGSAEVFVENGGDKFGLHSNSETPPTPHSFEGGVDKFLESKGEAKFDFDTTHAWVLDHIYVYDEGRLFKKGTLSNVDRVMLHFKDSDEKTKLTENCLTWMNHWNETWRNSDEGVEEAKRTARMLTHIIISDHFPITANVQIDFKSKEQGATQHELFSN